MWETVHDSNILRKTSQEAKGQYRQRGTMKVRRSIFFTCGYPTRMQLTKYLHTYIATGLNLSCTIKKFDGLFCRSRMVKHAQKLEPLPKISGYGRRAWWQDLSCVHGV